MKTIPEHDARIANMAFATVYPLYVAKIEKKGRTEAELRQVILWLTGFDEKRIQEFLENRSTFQTFFEQAALHPNVHLIQ